MKTLSLRVDVDTLQGSLSGIPTLLKMLEKHGIQAGFYFSFGPDHSGRAIRRIFRKGFLSKMSRTNPVKLYGIKTMLYGTLWPAPIIFKEARAWMLRAEEAGHEVGIHAWDHVDYHDLLDQKSDQWLTQWFQQSHDAFRDVFGRAARAAVSPAWRCNDRTLLIQEQYGLDYAGDCRGTEPFYPIVQGQVLKTLQIPTTLPTLDELLGLDGRTAADVNREIIRLVKDDALNVYALHTEVEGGALLESFDDLLSGLKAEGVRFLTHEAWLPELKQRAISPRPMDRGFLPGRSGWLSMA